MSPFANTDDGAQGAFNPGSANGTVSAVTIDPTTTRPLSPATPVAQFQDHAASDRPARSGWPALWVILVSGLFLRLLVLPFGNFAFDTATMGRWATRLTQLPLDRFYATSRLVDHLPGDLWLLLGVAQVHAALFPTAGFQSPSFVIALKLTAIAADLGICVMLFLLGRKLGGPSSGLCAAALYALNPAPIFLAAGWGQWDAVAALVLLVALWCQIQGASEWSLPILVYAALIKPPLAALVPVFIIAALLQWRQASRHPAAPHVHSLSRNSRYREPLRIGAGLFGSALVVITVCTPFSVGLPFLSGRWSLLERVQYAAAVHPYTTVNAFNVWAVINAHALLPGPFISDDGTFLIGASFRTWGIGMTALLGVVIALLMIWRWRGEATLICATSALLLALFVLPTRMHERYLLPALAATALLTGLAPCLRWTFGFLSLGFLGNLVWAYDQYYPLAVPDWWHTDRFVFAFSCLNLVVLLILVATLGRPAHVSPGIHDGTTAPSEISRGSHSHFLPAQWFARAWGVAQHVGFVAILLLASLLNSYALRDAGFGNLYYAAAVKSMAINWHNFLFAAFDPAGFLAVDKPPVGLWLQVLTTQIFGFTSVSLRLPQVVAGILSVALLYHLVAPSFGRTAGLVASGTLALTPIAVVTNRNNTMDSVLLLVLLLAGWAAMRATRTGRVSWLLLCGGLIGIGFNIKMAEAFLVAPACLLPFAVAAPIPRWARWRGVVLATLLMLGVSLTWLMAVDLTPASQRPYLASTTRNSAIELAIEHNGLDRLLWGHSMSHPGAQGDLSRKTIGDPGPLRLLDRRLATQFGWLLPLAAIGSLAAVSGKLDRSDVWHWPRAGSLDQRQQDLLFWGTWFLTGAVFFSTANYFHRYYTIVLAPALAALVAIGLIALWQAFWRPGLTRWLLPFALLLTAAFQVWLLAPDADWRLRLAPGLMTLTLLASLTLWHLARSAQGSERFVARCAVIAGMTALLLAPTTWSIVSIWQGEANAAFPFAGPVAAVRQPSTQINTRFLQYLQARRTDAEVLLVTMTTEDAAPLIIRTQHSVLAFGGYSGHDPLLTTEQFAAWVTEGKIRFFLLPKEKQSPTDGALHWVAQHCDLVAPSDWQPQLTSPTPADSLRHEVGGGRPQPANRRLFDCGAYIQSPEPVNPSQKPNAAARSEERLTPYREHTSAALG